MTGSAGEVSSEERGNEGKAENRKGPQLYIDTWKLLEQGKEKSSTDEHASRERVRV